MDDNDTSETGNGRLLARIDERTQDTNESLEKLEKEIREVGKKIDRFIEHHNENDVSKTHTAYFKVMGVALVVVGGGVVAALLKAFAKI